MASELWQRLREARKYADKRQIDVARLLGITRSGYAFHEWATPEGRTTPNVTQIKQIAEFLKVPLEYLMNDNVEVSDLYRSEKMAGFSTMQDSPSPRAAPPETERAKQRWWAAVEYMVVNDDPARESAFGRTVRAGAIELAVDYLHGRALAVQTTAQAQQELLPLVGYMLMLETAARVRGAAKLILVRAPGEPPQDLVESVRSTWGVNLVWTQDPEQAAAQILAMQ